MCYSSSHHSSFDGNYISDTVSDEPGARNMSKSRMSVGATRMPSAAKRDLGPSFGALVMG